jgi:hypothetical protein
MFHDTRDLINDRITRLVTSVATTPFATPR